SDLRAPTPTAAAELATPNSQDLIQKIGEFTEQIKYRTAQFFGTKKTEIVYLDQRLDRLSPSLKLDQLKNDLSRYSDQLSRNIINQFDFKKQKLEGLKNKLKRPDEKIRGYQEKQNNLFLRLERNIQMVAQRKNYQFDLLRTSLQSLNPLLMMDKGYAVVSKNDHVVTSVRDIEITDQLSIRFKDGTVGAKVTEKKEN
ncbi:MAG TPA: hypothetical protein DEG42_05690, partial [Acholeplasmataceae bacterium]|nr:hypothetical protein [Acholeplasmataceae bacterium]